MSRSLQAPWIKSAICDILAGAPGTPQFDQPYRVKGRRGVQVLAVNEHISSLTISDTDVSIHAFLTEECFRELMTGYPVQTLKFCMINLDDFCISTVTQAAGNQDMKTLTQAQVMFPLALHCFKVTVLGASDCTILGAPTPLNASKAVLALLRRFQYRELRKRLALAQFPLQKALPDWENTFEEEMDTEWKPRKEHFVRPAEQARIMDALGSLECGHIISTLPALLYDEFGPDGHGNPGSRRQVGGSKHSGSSSTSNHQAAEDGWADTWRDDIEHAYLSHPWSTQHETLTAGDRAYEDGDFPVDSDAEEGAPAGHQAGLLGDGLGTGTQVGYAETQVDDGTLQETQFSQPIAAFSPIKTRQARLAQAATGSASSQASARPSPAPSPARPPQPPLRRGPQGTQLETVPESEDEDRGAAAALTAQPTAQQMQIQALYAKLANAPELTDSGRNASDQSQVFSLAQSSATVASPASTGHSAALHQSSASAPEASAVALTGSSASATSQPFGAGTVAAPGWLDRVPASIITQAERDTMFDFLDSQQPSQFLFPSTGVAAGSSSGAVCLEEDELLPAVQIPATPSLLPAAPTSAAEQVASAASQNAVPGLFRTQPNTAHGLPTPSRPSKAPVGSHSAPQSSTQPPLSQSQASASYRSPGAQSQQVVMINGNDSAPNQMMTKTGKYISFRPGGASEASQQEGAALVGTRVRLRSGSGFRAGLIKQFDGEVLHIVFDDGNKETMTMAEAKRWLTEEPKAVTADVSASGSARQGTGAGAGVVPRSRLTSAEVMVYCEDDHDGTPAPARPAVAVRPEPLAGRGASSSSSSVPAGRTPATPAEWRALTAEEVARLSDAELVDYGCTIVLPEGFRNPTLAAYKYNARAMLGDLPRLLAEHARSTRAPPLVGGAALKRAASNGTNTSGGGGGAEGDDYWSELSAGAESRAEKRQREEAEAKAAQEAKTAKWAKRQARLAELAITSLTDGR